MSSPEAEPLLDNPDAGPSTQRDIVQDALNFYNANRKAVMAGGGALAFLLLCYLVLGGGGGGGSKGVGNGISDGSMKKDLRLSFLKLNSSPNWLPLSYMVDPPDYFEKVPKDLLPHLVDSSNSGTPPECPEADRKVATAAQWDAYTWQTEQMLVSKGCNIYDAAVGAIALSVGGHADFASYFYRQILDVGATAGLSNIRGNARCVGRQAFGECDPAKDGNCGLCYGDGNSTLTPPYRQAWFFRMIGDSYAYEEAENPLCPLANTHVEKKANGPPAKPRSWTWVDWKPVLGDNAWVLLTGAAQVLWQDCKGKAKNIPDDAPELTLALDFAASLKAMTAGGTGGLYFCPRNTYYGAYHVDIGSLLSTENNASLLAGLKALRYLLKSMKNAIYDDKIKEIEDLIEGIMKFLKSAYDPTLGQFRTGGRYNSQDGTIKWDDIFAVDCQSWVGSVLGPQQIDKWFGSGTALALWEKTKKVAGYARQPNGMVKGVGYTSNEQDQVFSGEWSLGAANFLKIMAIDSSYSGSVKAELHAQAKLIAKAIKEELTRKVKFFADEAEGVLYANKRYLIPADLGGWWTNPIPSRASTAWSFLWDANFNPLHLQGHFSADYDM